MDFYIVAGNTTDPVSSAYVTSWIRRMQQAVNDYKQAFRNGDVGDMYDAAEELNGCATVLQDIAVGTFNQE